MAEDDSGTGPRPPLPRWVRLAALREALVRLLEPYPALAAIVDKLVEEIYVEIARPVPRICAIPHRVLELKHLLPLTSRQGMPSGFDLVRDDLGFRVCIISADGWSRVKWRQGDIVGPDDKAQPIEIYSPALEDWVQFRATHQRPRSKKVAAQPAASKINLTGTLMGTLTPYVPGAPAADQKRKHPGGAPRKHDWVAIERQEKSIKRGLGQKASPKDVLAKLLEWCELKYEDKAPTGNTLRLHLQKRPHRRRRPGHKN